MEDRPSPQADLYIRPQDVKNRGTRREETQERSRIHLNQQAIKNRSFILLRIIFYNHTSIAACTPPSTYAPSQPRSAIIFRRPHPIAVPATCRVSTAMV